MVVARKEAESKKEAQAVLVVVNELKEKKRRMTVMMGDAMDEESRKQLSDRVAVLDATILEKYNGLQAVRQATQIMIQSMNRLRASKGPGNVQALVQRIAQTWMRKARRPHSCPLL